MKYNTLCQSCESRPRSKVIYTYNEGPDGGPDVWLLCDECTRSSSKFSPNHKDNRDLTNQYRLGDIYLRDMNFDKAYSRRTDKSFFFKLICSDGSIGDTYQYIPGLQRGYTKLTVFIISWYEKSPITELTLNCIGNDIKRIVTAKHEKGDPYYGGPALLLLRQLEDECLNRARWLR
jgi:hypothetical protein